MFESLAKQYQEWKTNLEYNPRVRELLQTELGLGAMMLINPTFVIGEVRQMIDNSLQSAELLQDEELNPVFVNMSNEIFKAITEPNYHQWVESEIFGGVATEYEIPRSVISTIPAVVKPKENASIGPDTIQIGLQQTSWGFEVAVDRKTNGDCYIVFGFKEAGEIDPFTAVAIPLEIDAINTLEKETFPMIVRAMISNYLGFDVNKFFNDLNVNSYFNSFYKTYSFQNNETDKVSTLIIGQSNPSNHTTGYFDIAQGNNGSEELDYRLIFNLFDDDLGNPDNHSLTAIVDDEDNFNYDKTLATIYQVLNQLYPESNELYQEENQALKTLFTLKFAELESEETEETPSY